MVKAARLTSLQPRVGVAGLRFAEGPKVADQFYVSPEWRLFVQGLKVDRFGHPSNAHCQDPKCKYPGRGCRVFADHVVEIKDGGARLDPRNIMFRCGSCHTRVTNERKALRNKRQW